MRYDGKKDAWWYGVALIINALLCYTIYVSVSVLWATILTSTILLIIDIFFISVTVKNFITLESDKMVIYFGFFKTNVNYTDIINVTETRTLLAGSATSLDRIMIKTKKGDIIISVKYKKEFIKELEKLCNNI